MKMGWTIQKIVDYNGTIISGGKSIGGFGIAHHLLVRLHRVVICRPAALITCLRLLDRDCCLSGSSSSFPPWFASEIRGNYLNLSGILGDLPPSRRVELSAAFESPRPDSKNRWELNWILVNKNSPHRSSTSLLFLDRLFPLWVHPVAVRWASCFPPRHLHSLIVLLVHVHCCGGSRLVLALFVWGDWWRSDDSE